MLGNDVVDLADAETRPEGIHPRFDRRVFAPEEIGLLQRSSSPERLRWKLWAAKESAYKAMKKLDPLTIFSPARFIVTPEGSARATVRMQDRSISVCFEDVGEEAVHAVAVAARPPEGSLVSGVRQLPEEPTGDSDTTSAAVRQFVIDALVERFDIPAGEIEIHSEGRVPQLRIRGAPAELSLSHHGRFVAFAVLTPIVLHA